MYYYEIFKELHTNKLTTPTQKQIYFRIIYDITPTTEGIAKRTGKRIRCTTCRHDIQETQQHIFFDCPNLNITKKTVRKFLEAKLNRQETTQLDLDRAIFLNQHQEKDGDYRQIKQLILGIYRETIWQVRNSTRHYTHTLFK